MGRADQGKAAQRAQYESKAKRAAVELVQVVNRMRFVPGISEFFDLLAASYR